MKVIKNIKDIPGDLLGNFNVDETVWLDKAGPNQCLVTIKQFADKFCLVQDIQGQQYEVMIYRLTKY